MTLNHISPVSGGLPSPRSCFSGVHPANSVSGTMHVLSGFSVSLILVPVVAYVTISDVPAINPARASPALRRPASNTGKVSARPADTPWSNGHLGDAICALALTDRASDLVEQVHALVYLFRRGAVAHARIQIAVVLEQSTPDHRPPRRIRRPDLRKGTQGLPIADELAEMCAHRDAIARRARIEYDDVRRGGDDGGDGDRVSLGAAINLRFGAGGETLHPFSFFRSRQRQLNGTCRSRP